jgi:HEAT repeat protein
VAASAALLAGPPFPSDPVEAFRQALLQDRLNPSAQSVAQRRKTLIAAADNLRTLGDMGRALLLLEWGSGGLGTTEYALAEAQIDDEVRQAFVKRYIEQARKALTRGDPIEQEAAASLIAQTVAGARSRDTEPGRDDFGRVAKGPTVRYRYLRRQLQTLSGDLEKLALGNGPPQVRAAAARALGNMESEPRQTVQTLQRLLQPGEPVVVRRAAAEALGTLVQAGIQLNTETLGLTELPPDQPRTRVPTEAELQRLRYRGEPFRTAIVVVPAAGKALLDGDPEVRRLAISAAQRASAALVNLMPTVNAAELPPQDRPLTDKEREEVLTEQARVNAMLEGINPLLEAYRGQSANLTRALSDEDPAVRLDARRIMEDLALCAQKLQRAREQLAYPELKAPDKKTGRAARAGVDVARVAPQAPAACGPAEACSPLPPPRAAEEGAALEAPVALSPEEAAAAGRRAVPTHTASFVQKGGEDLPPPKPAGASDPALATVGRSLSALVAGLNDPLPRVRLATLDVLETMGEAAVPAIPALVGALRDPTLFVRWQAARILGRLAPQGAAEAVPVLARMIGREQDVSLRLAVATALGRYGPAAAAAVGPLVRAMGATTDVDLRVSLLKALEAIGPGAAPALPAIAAGLQNASPKVREESARVLGRFGPLAKAYLPQLRPALNDPADEVRRAASAAILAINRP